MATGSGDLQSTKGSPTGSYARKPTRRVAAIGGGIYGVAPTGLLDGREVTTHWRYASDVARVSRACVSIPKGISLRMACFIHLPVQCSYRSFARSDRRRLWPACSVCRCPGVCQRIDQGNGHYKLPNPLVFDSQPADRFAELVPWIMRNLHQDLSVNTLARKACMSPSHFNRAFKSVFGSTPTEFVETLRINEAKRRLSVPKRTLIRSLPLLVFRMRKHFSAHSNGDLDQSRAAI